MLRFSGTIALFIVLANCQDISQVSYCKNRKKIAQLRKTEFQKISNLLEKNRFPLNYINRQIQHFLAKKQSKKTQNRQEGRYKTDFYETSLYKRNERPYTKRN